MTRIVESKNARFLENDEISGSSQSQNLIFEEDNSFEPTPTSSHRLVVIHDNHQDSITQEQPIIEQPHHHEDNPVDSVTQHPQIEDVDVTLRRSSRTRKPAISSNYVMYL